MLSYWKDYSAKRPNDPLGPKKVADIIANNKSAYERNLAATAGFDMFGTSLGQLALGAGMSAEALQRLVAPPEALVEQKGETKEEAKTSEEREILRRNQYYETLELQERLANQAVEKGILPDFLLHRSILKYADIKRNFELIESCSDGNCLPQALLMAIPALFMKATVRDCNALRHRVGSYFRKHGYIENGDGDRPEEPESKRRVIRADTPELDEKDPDVERYSRARTVAQFVDIMERSGSYQGEAFLTSAAMSTNCRIIVLRCLNPTDPIDSREYKVEHYGISPIEESTTYFLLLSGIHYDSLITLAEGVRRRQIKEAEEIEGRKKKEEAPKTSSAELKKTKKKAKKS